MDEKTAGLLIFMGLIITNLCIFEIGKIFDTDKFSPFFAIGALFLPSVVIGIIVFHFAIGIWRAFF